MNLEEFHAKHRNAAEITDSTTDIRIWMPQLGPRAAVIFSTLVPHLDCGSWKTHGRLVNAAPMSGIAIEDSASLTITIYKDPSVGYSDGRDRKCHIQFHYGIRRAGGVMSGDVTAKMYTNIYNAVTAAFEEMAAVLHPVRNPTMVALMEASARRERKNELIRAIKKSHGEMEQIRNEYLSIVEDSIHMDHAIDGLDRSAFTLEKDKTDSNLIQDLIASLRRQLSAYADVFIPAQTTS